MKVTIRYFAGLREEIGISTEEVDLLVPSMTVGALKGILLEKGRRVLGTTKNLRYAVNQEMARTDSIVIAGDEIAFFPPVTGG